MNYEDFLKELESVERGSALKFMNNKFSKWAVENYDKPSSLLFGAFDFKRTNEGYKYWVKVYYELVYKERNELL